MNPLMVIQPLSLFLVAAGGAMGCVLRYLVIQHLVMRLHPSPFPLGTMLVNILGSLLIGAVLARYGGEHSSRAFLVTGLLGGFTTFSAFSWDALMLLQRGQVGQALLYIGGSVLLSLLAVALGFHLVR